MGYVLQIVTLTIALLFSGSADAQLAPGATKCRATTAAPSYSDGKPAELSCDLSGNLRTAGGAGGGGAATIADGADVTQGAIADAAVTTNTTGTVSGKLRGLVAILADVWDSVNHYFKVQIQNATLAVTQSGTWTVQPGNTANTTAWKVDGSAVTQPVSGTFWQATQPVSGTVTTIPPSNASTNISQFGGTNISTGTGAGGAGIPRITVSNDSNVLTTQSGTWTNRIVGNAGGAIDAANNAAMPANSISAGCETATQTSTQPTAATAANIRHKVCSTDGNLYVRPHGPVIWSCGVTAIGTTLTQCQAAPGASLRLYITDVVSQSNTSTAGLFTLRFGTGSNCGTGTGNLFFTSASALMASPANTAPVNHFHLTTPIAVTANNAVCVLGVVTNTTNAQINGYTAP